MTSLTERSLVERVARFSPWVAPFPSAYFVGRSSVKHLAVPTPVGGVIALVVETLGISSMHTVLWLVEWNNVKRKSDPAAPAFLSAISSVVYFLATLSLSVVLEVVPSISRYAPALFPLLAIVGILNLVLIAQQKAREAEQARDREERKARRGRRASDVKKTKSDKPSDKSRRLDSRTPGSQPNSASRYLCWCKFLVNPDPSKSIAAQVSSHKGRHTREARQSRFASPLDVLNWWNNERYPDQTSDALISKPTPWEVAVMREKRGKK